MISTNLGTTFKVLSVRSRSEPIQLGISLSSNKHLRLNALDERNLILASSSKAKLIVVDPAVIKPDLTKLGRVIGNEEGLSLIPFCSMLVLAIFILMLLDDWVVAKAKITTLSHLHQVPCRNCHFFKENDYLRCTVHPSLVLSVQALDCADYRSPSKS